MTGKEEERLVRFNRLNNLIVDKVYKNDNGSLTIGSGMEGFTATAQARDGETIEAPSIREIAPELAELIKKIVDRGFVMEFNSLSLRAFLRPSDSDDEIASSNLQNWSFSEVIPYFEEQSRLSAL